MKMRLVAWLIACAFGAATSAVAQTTAAAKKPGPKRAKEFVVGGILAGPSSLGSADAILLGGTGSSAVTLFRTENRMATGYGVELNLGLAIRKALWAEVGGGWTHAGLGTKITSDFEGAESETLSSPMSRFTLEGALLWYFRERGKTSWFVRAGGGWMRETAGGNTLTGDGVIGGGGAGVRHWWRTNGKGSVKRLGFRAEFRAGLRSGGISLGEGSLRFGVGGAGHVVFGF